MAHFVVLLCATPFLLQISLSLLESILSMQGRQLFLLSHMSNLIPRNHQENYYLSKIVADLDWTAIEENSVTLLKQGSLPIY